MYKRFLMLIIFLSTEPLFAEKIKLCYEDKEIAPYQMTDGVAIPSKNPGVSIELLQLAAKESGLEIEFTRSPWLRCLASTAAGDVDGSFSASYTEERLKYGSYPAKDGKLDKNRRITTLSYSIYKLKDSNLMWDGKSITNIDKPIGAPRGYSIIENLTKMNLPVDESASTMAAMKKLVGGRISAVATQTSPGDSLIASDPEFKSIVKLEPTLVSKDYFLILSKQFIQKNNSLAESFWDNIAKYRESSFEALMSTYTKALNP